MDTLDYQEYEDIRKRVDRRLRKQREFWIHTLFFITFNVLFWSVWSSGLNFGWHLPWPSIITLFWFGGWMTNAVEVMRGPDNRTEYIFRTVDRQMTELYGRDWPEDAEPGVADKLDQGVRRRIRKRIEFWGSLLNFIPSNLVFWLLWDNGLTFGWDFPWPLIPMAFWGIGLVAQFIGLIFTDGGVVIQKEIQREKARRRKRQQKQKNKAKRLGVESEGTVDDYLPDDQTIQLADSEK